MTLAHVITVHHRGKEMLGRCLESLLASRGVELEIVVVANHCSEELPGIVDTAPRVHLVVSETSLGFSAANNLGVEWARRHLGEPACYYFINNDTESPPGSLAALVDALERHPEAAVAGPRLLIQGASDHLNSLGLNVTEDAWGWDEGIGIALADYGPLPPTRSVAAVTGSALLIDAEVHRRIGGWTEIYGYYFEDIDLCIKVWKHGREVLQVAESTVLHRISATMSVGSQRKLFLFWRNRLLLAMIHWPPTLLARLLARALGSEILWRKWSHSDLQRRALWGALRRLPALLSQRRRLRGDAGWRRFLVPAGSVPVITLPEIPAPEAVPVVVAEDPPGVVGGRRIAVAPATWRRAEPRGPRRQGRRVLVLGWSPLPFENQRMNYAPGMRAWQLARPLAEDGHTVCLICARIPGACFEGDPPVAELARDGVLIYTMERDVFEAPGVLEELVERFAPDVLVGAAANPSQRAVQLAEDRPVWVDLFGDPMAEAQAKAAADGEGEELLHAYSDLLLPLLARGDAFAAVSERQRDAAVGQLGMAGRLNRATSGAELVHTVPCAAEGSEPLSDAAPPEDLAPGDFVVLWSGGYNTWCDVETLFGALELAMARQPELRFVSTGGAIPGHDDGTYHRFVELVEGSATRQRYLLKGCLSEAEARRYLARADLGVVTERPIYERYFGSSGRVLRWLSQGLPVVCARFSELSFLLESEPLGLTYPPGDAEALADKLLLAARDRPLLRRFAEAGRAYAAEHLSFAATTRPLRRWAAAADRAADRGEAPQLVVPRVRLERAHGQLAAAQRELQAARRRADQMEESYHQARAELGRIHHSRMWRLWMAYLAPRRWLRQAFSGRR